MSKKEIKDVVIFGTGRFAEIISKYFQRYTDYKIIAYIDTLKDKKKIKQKESLILSPEEFLNNIPTNSCKMFIAVGYREMNSIRSNLFLKYKKIGYSFVSFIHPNVEWWDNSIIGENSFIFESNVIQQNVVIGNSVILWSGNHIGHHSSILDNVWITSHVVVYSDVVIGKNCFIGSNTNIRDGISIGCHNFIGAGSNIWKSTEDRH